MAERVTRVVGAIGGEGCLDGAGGVGNMIPLPLLEYDDDGSRCSCEIPCTLVSYQAPRRSRPCYEPRQESKRDGGQ